MGPEVNTATPSSVGDVGGVGFEFAMPEEQMPEDISPRRTTSPVPDDQAQNLPQTGNSKEKKLSRHGIPVPKLPSGIVKKLATRFARTGHGSNTRITKDTLNALEQATEWFFEQASEDVSTYSKHAGRKTIDESDMIALMRR